MARSHTIRPVLLLTLFHFTSAQGQIAVQIALAYLPEVNNSRLALVRLMPETEYRQLSQPENEG